MYEREVRRKLLKGRGRGGGVLPLKIGPTPIWGRAMMNDTKPRRWQRGRRGGRCTPQRRRQKPEVFTTAAKGVENKERMMSKRIKTDGVNCNRTPD